VAAASTKKEAPSLRPLDEIRRLHAAGALPPPPPPPTTTQMANRILEEKFREILAHEGEVRALLMRLREERSMVVEKMDCTRSDRMGGSFYDRCWAERSGVRIVDLLQWPMLPRWSGFRTGIITTYIVEDQAHPLYGVKFEYKHRRQYTRMPHWLKDFEWVREDVFYWCISADQNYTKE
jgi:hypothetical protein